ncbi:MAG: hypothetical protein IK081_13370 [Lachnospiraceae bacterium]|nr:hypothetical protein [Lachnospiraceae bacterium]
MTYDTYRLIFYASIALAVFCLLLAIALFFLLNIPAVIGDLSGSTERKAIANIRNRNESGANGFGAGILEMGNSSNLSGKVRDLSKVRGNTDGMGFVINTAKFNTNALATEARESYETTLLTPESNETTVLAQPGNETTVLGNGGASQETTVLSPFDNPASASGNYYSTGFGETAVLNQAPMQPAASTPEMASQFVIEYEITFIHTDEVIA